jgi:hypothetical protein
MVGLSFSGLFLQILSDREGSRGVSLQGQSVRMTEGSVRARDEGHPVSQNFLENSGYCFFS